MTGCLAVMSSDADEGERGVARVSGSEAERFQVLRHHRRQQTYVWPKFLHHGDGRVY